MVILSLVRASGGGSAGFARDERRINVALTRARHALVVLCHAATLRRAGGALAALVNDAAQRGLLLDEAAALESAPGCPAKGGAAGAIIGTPKTPAGEQQYLMEVKSFLEEAGGAAVLDKIELGVKWSKGVRGRLTNFLAKYPSVFLLQGHSVTLK